MKNLFAEEMTKEEILTRGKRRASTVGLEFVVFLLHLIGWFPSHHVRRFCYRLAGVKIGDGSTLHMGTRFYDPAHITIGTDTIIGEGAVLDGRAALHIGDHVDFASEVMIYNAQHDLESPTFSAEMAPVVIKDYVFVGPRAIILPGVTLEKGAVVAAGAVVTKDVEAFSVVGGIPAKVIGERNLKELHYRLGRAAWFR